MTGYNWKNFINAGDKQAEQQAHAERFPLNEETVGRFITDEEHIKFIANNSDEYLNPAIATAYLAPEDFIYLKQYDDYYTEIVFLGEDSFPIFSSSFDIFADRAAVLDRLAFIAYFLLRVNNWTEATQQQFVHADRLYTAFKAEEAATGVTADHFLLLWVYQADQRDDITAADFFSTKRAAYLNPTTEQRQALLNIMNRFNS